MEQIILILILIMSVIAFFVMGYDKSQAKKHGQRISERTLWTLAIFGGAIGSYLGMNMFRHKTKHTNFRLGFLMLMILYAFFIFYILITDSSIIA
ncbi:uncharacterized membrane protein YsdA (DUF1294 family) [Psychrobacillus insolitus]|uniref:Uncharacterized membrane protein YsdA (DUF1294 family) n=1 Tax=Psychrobacillus insolitus TaxID=1461 RepID=A0A2W7N4W7_9BACI|nr:DUF1294 domain-containing protein [Psychrobacillus insolitus]PZX06993.1 uncharacterized membrane protein YsdA (DUF1294 family) [Psychrobacillus insolitus]